MNWRIPLFDPDLGKDEIEALTDVINSKWLTQGARTERFEKAFAEFVGARFAVAVNSCTAALHLALRGAGISVGDEVICPSLTFVATANAIRYCGASPVFADVTSSDCWNISAATIEPLITARTKAIIVVHYAGYVCDMPPILKLAERHGLTVVEDVAHAPGATLDGRAAGTWGSSGCFSFFSNKNMTTAEGGMLTTDDEAVMQTAQRLRCHGMTSVTLDRHKGHNFSYDVTDLGYNYRMSELNAAVGLVQLATLEARNEKRRLVTQRYRKILSDLDIVDVPFSDPPGNAAYHIFPILLRPGVQRETVMSGLRDRSVQSSIHYRPVHTFTCFDDFAVGHNTLPLTNEIGTKTLTLPLYPSMTMDDVEFVCQSLRDAIENR